MGNEESTPIDERIPPEKLESRTLKGLSSYIRDGKAKKIVIMTGAGISTGAGIPDFRSPDTGLYANLARLSLPYPEAVFDISFFRRNPLPFYTLAQELYPGKYRPTMVHCFIKLLHNKGLLLKHFTQNIDCLDREAGVPGNKIIEAHGSFANQSCIECGASFPENLMQEAVKEKKAPYCLECKGLVKPGIVFFGEALPAEFFMNRHVPGQADLCIILGTSLTVQPFASLPSLISDGVPRVLVNKERVGSIGSRADDVLLLGDCDEGVCKLAEECGWLEELKTIWKSTRGPEEAEKAAKTQPADKDKAIEEEVNKLTKDIDKTLAISEEHERQTREELSKEIADDLKGKPKNGTSSSKDTKVSTDSKDADSNLNHVYPHIKSNLS